MRPFIFAAHTAQHQIVNIYQFYFLIQQIEFKFIIEMELEIAHEIHNETMPNNVHFNRELRCILYLHIYLLF